MPDIINLKDKKCVACEGGIPAMARSDAELMLAHVSGWSLNEEGTEIAKELKTKDFMDSMRVAGEIAKIAEEEGHHPDLSVSWGKLGIRLSTHAVKGLSENDFILAAKIDELLKKDSTAA